MTGAEQPAQARTSEMRPMPRSSDDASGAWIPYLTVLGLGFLALILVVVQVWAYRDELRAIVSQTPI